MGMSSGGGGNRAPMADINITPMVDVMLVLLIIFIVAAPMISETGLEVDLPDTRAPEMPVDEEKLILTIQKTEEGAAEPHKIFLGETEIPNDRVDEALSSNARLASEGEVYIKADEMIPYGVVVRVFAAIRRAGIEKVGLVTDPAGTE